MQKLLKEIIKRFIPSKMHLKYLYRKNFSEKLDLNNPKTFNEKLQWLKLYNRNPLYTILVDKYAVREYIKEEIGEEYLVSLIGGPWKSVDEIPFDVLPNQFVLKTTHDSGGVVICKSKAEFDIEAARKKLTWSLKRKFFYVSREWSYKNVSPQIIAEQYLDAGNNTDLADYKFMCFNGSVKCVLVCEGRNTENGLKITFYDREWQVMPVERIIHPKNDKIKEKPINYLKMIELAEQLAREIPFLRVDFYEAQGKIYFGELTFYPASGLEGFNPPEWDRILGDWLVLPEKKI